MGRRRSLTAEGDHVAPIRLFAQEREARQPPARVDRGEQWGVGRSPASLLLGRVTALEGHRLLRIPQLGHTRQQSLAPHQRAVFAPRPSQRVEPAHVDVKPVHACVEAHLVVDDDVRQHRLSPLSMGRDLAPLYPPAGNPRQPRARERRITLTTRAGETPLPGPRQVFPVTPPRVRGACRYPHVSPPAAATVRCCYAAPDVDPASPVSVRCALRSPAR